MAYDPAYAERQKLIAAQRLQELQEIVKQRPEYRPEWARNIDPEQVEQASKDVVAGPMLCMALGPDVKFTDVPAEELQKICQEIHQALNADETVSN